MVKFVILYYKRSGSTYLKSVFSNIDKKSIVFSKYNQTSDGKISISEIDRILLEYNEYDFVGFKVPYQESNEKLFEYISENDFKVIKLFRENIFEQYVSEQLSRNTNVWNIYNQNELECRKNVKLFCDYTSVFEYFMYVEDIKLKINNRFSNGIECIYPKFINEMHRICDYIEFNEENLSHNTTLKLERMPLNMRVINYYDLKHKFKNSEYSKFFIH